MRPGHTILPLVAFLAVLSHDSVAFAQEPVPSSEGYSVRPVELSTASYSGFAGSGLILEIENTEPGLELVIDAASVKLKTRDGALHSPVLMFYVNILRGQVEPVSIAGTQLQGVTIRIGKTSYKAYTSMATMAVNLESGGGMKYVFKEPSVFQIAFVFSVDEADMAGLDFLTRSVDLSRTGLDLAGDWEGTTTWPELTVRVGFAVEEGSMFISGARVMFECKEGEPQTKAELTADGRFRIGEDGSFQAGFGETGERLSGKFASSSEVSGDLEGGLSAQCGEKMVNVSGRWSAVRD